MAYGVSNGHVTDARHVTSKGHARDPNMLRPQYVEKGWI